MKKLELKNLKVKALSKDEKGKVVGGRTNIRTSQHCNSISYWPATEGCASIGWQCSGN